MSVTSVNKGCSSRFDGTPGTDRDANGVPSVRVKTRSGHWLTFHGTRTESRPGRGGETMVIVDPSRSQELNAFDKLGARGRRVVVERLFFENLYPELLG